MLSHLQKFLALGLLATALGWAAWAGLQGRWLLAPLGLLLVCGGYGLILAGELLTLHCVHGQDPAPRARPGQLLRAWWGELLASPRVFCWQQPFRSQAEPDHLAAGAGRGVLLVHGLVCNRGFWNRWMRRLRLRGVPFVAVSLTPVWGSITCYADAVETAVQRLEAATGEAPVIVAHSMGGLAVRVWLARPGNALRVRRVITLGSPHHGAWLARWGHSRNAREMRQGSAFLLGLQAAETPAVRALFTCFYSHCDNVVFPASTGALPGADNRHVEGVAHVQLADYAPAFDETLRWLKRPALPGGSR